MAEELRGRRVAILSTDGVEQVELTQPARRLPSISTDPPAFCSEIVEEFAESRHRSPTRA